MIFSLQMYYLLALPLWRHFMKPCRNHLMKSERFSEDLLMHDDIANCYSSHADAAWCIFFPSFPLYFLHPCAWTFVTQEVTNFCNLEVSCSNWYICMQLFMKHHFTEVSNVYSLIIQGPDSKAANELINIDGVVNVTIRNLEQAYVS